jgi:GNAT superfamily N-acetyltransferase
MPETSIRPLAPADREAWEPLWQGYLTFYKASVAAGVTDRTFERLTGGGEPMGAFVAERDGRMVGIVHYVMHRTTWSQSDICYLQDLFVAPGTRGGGVGAALIETVRAMAEKQGCFRVYWQTHESNDTAMKLYDRVAQKSGFLVYRIPLP